MNPSPQDNSDPLPRGNQKPEPLPQDSGAIASESPESVAYAWYGGELIASTNWLTESDRLSILETHAFFDRAESG